MQAAAGFVALVPSPPHHGMGQPRKVMCRAQRNTDALLTPVAMVESPAKRPTTATPAATQV